MRSISQRWLCQIAASVYDSIPNSCFNSARLGVANGKYRSTDEVLLAGLELLAAKDAASEQARYAELRREIEVGLAEAERGELIDGA